MSVSVCCSVLQCAAVCCRVHGIRLDDVSNVYIYMSTLHTQTASTFTLDIQMYAVYTSLCTPSTSVCTPSTHHSALLPHLRYHHIYMSALQTLQHLRYQHDLFFDASSPFWSHFGHQPPPLAGATSVTPQHSVSTALYVYVQALPV